jgi:Tfp pilus assembly protein PilF
MAKALATGTIDPMLEFHAGAIAKANGDATAARKHLARALEIDPRFHVLHAATAKQMLAELKSSSNE